MAKRTSVAGTEQDPTIKFARAMLAGKEYSLCYDFNAIAETEALLWAVARRVDPDAPRPNLMHGMATLILGAGYTATDVRGLLYAALKKAHPAISLQETGLLCGIEDISDIVTHIQKAYNLSMEKPKDPPAGDANPPGES